MEYEFKIVVKTEVQGKTVDPYPSYQLTLGDRVFYLYPREQDKHFLKYLLKQVGIL